MVEKQDVKRSEKDYFEKKINVYTLKFLDEICEELANKGKFQDNIYLNTKEAFAEKQKNINKNNSRKKLSPKKSINKDTNIHALLNSNKRCSPAKFSSEDKVNPVLNDNVIRIQRAFKRFYLRNKCLPENFFFTQKILKHQFEKRHKNFQDNYKVLFPLSNKKSGDKNFELNNTIDTIKTGRNRAANMNSNNETLLISNLIHNPYEQ